MYFRSRNKKERRGDFLKDERMSSTPGQMKTGQVGKRKREEEDEDGPPGYEGKEHVRYREPGYSKEEIDIPEETPHMKSRNSREEAHEMEDNYHMDIPDQTEYTLPKKIKRAFMKMDQPDEEGPKPLYGNLVTKVSNKGLRDETGWEEYGPEEMQEEDEKNSPSRSHRKKIAIAVIKRKMNKKR